MATRRYVVNPEPMDIALVDKPAHIGIRDSQAGYGNRCLIVECGGVDVDAGLEAFRAAFPDMAVFADRGAALAALGLACGHGRPMTLDEALASMGGPEEA